MDAGTIHGITDGAIFGLYNDRSLVATQPPVATLQASNPGAFSTKLIPVQEGSQFPISERASALLLRAGKQEDLRICVEPGEKLTGVVRGLAKEMEADGSTKSRFMLVEKEKAELEIAFDDEDRIVFNILDPLVTSHGLTRIPFVVSPTPGAMAPVLSKVARYFWHLRRTSKRVQANVEVEPARLGGDENDLDPTRNARKLDLIKDNVAIEFRRLEEAEDDYDDDFNHIRKPCGENLIKNGIVDIVIQEDAIYGIKLTNKGNKPLYPSLFYFDNSNFSIGKWSRMDASTGWY
jgi:hypothetical protein